MLKLFLKGCFSTLVPLYSSLGAIQIIRDTLGRKGGGRQCNQMAQGGGQPSCNVTFLALF